MAGDLKPLCMDRSVSGAASFCLGEPGVCSGVMAWRVVLIDCVDGPMRADEADDTLWRYDTEEEAVVGAHKLKLTDDDGAVRYAVFVYPERAQQGERPTVAAGEVVVWK
jgi:hypothetical protein